MMAPRTDDDVALGWQGSRRGQGADSKVRSLPPVSALLPLSRSRLTLAYAGSSVPTGVHMT